MKAAAGRAGEALVLLAALTPARSTAD